MADNLTEAVAAMEAAWRRLREVLDGPDVAEAPVAARDSPRPMSTAPRDGTTIRLHTASGASTIAKYYEGWFVDAEGKDWSGIALGWSPVK